MALQMNVSGIRRNLKNIAHNYTDAQVKVREATSNDPWGPSSTLMSEIADLTYNVVAFSEIMQMIWKRLNDHGRNWRHVYKALVLLEYLIKTGSEKVAEQCAENIFAIQTLKDFQYLEDNKDQGMNVREKAKALVSLLKDEERLRNERVRALKAKERFAQSVSAIGSDSDINSPTSPSYPDTYVTSASRTEREAYGVREVPTSNIELEAARPQTVGEEELQLQLALAMSKEEAEQEEVRKRSDDVRLQMAITQSEEDFKSQETTENVQRDKEAEDKSAMNDLLDINFNPAGQAAAAAAAAAGSRSSPALQDPWGMSAAPPPPQPQKTDPWGGSPISNPPSRVTSPPVNDPWAPVTTTATSSPEPSKPAGLDDPWAPKPVVSTSPTPAAHDPWAPVSNPSTEEPATVDPFAPLSASNGDMDEFSMLSTREKPADGTSDPFSLGELSGELPDSPVVGNLPPKTSKSPATFLGENSNLVNLDNLVSTKPAPPGVNPFSSPAAPNPFQAQQQVAKPSMNQMRTVVTSGPLGMPAASMAPMATPAVVPPAATHNPWLPQQQQQQQQPPSTMGLGLAPPSAQSNDPFLL